MEFSCLVRALFCLNAVLIAKTCEESEAGQGQKIVYYTEYCFFQNPDKEIKQ